MWAGIAKGYLSVSVPIATPRASVDDRPARWIILSYLAFSVMILSGSVQIIYRIHESQKLGALELASLLIASWFVIGLSLITIDEVVVALLHGEVEIIRTEKAQIGAAIPEKYRS